jgi:fluoroacetyl-CoA thioesterase
VKLAPGLSYCAVMMVAEADTAAALGSGDVPVLATPRLLALAESAGASAVSPALAPGTTSVGTSAMIEHNKASPVGVSVSAEAELTKVEGGRLKFRFLAWHIRPGAPDHEREIVAVGTMERAVVDRERFLSRAAVGGPPGAPS